MPEVNHHEGADRMRRSSDVRTWCVAKTMLQELKYVWRWCSWRRVSQKLFSDAIIGLPNVDHAQHGNGSENAD